MDTILSIYRRKRNSKGRIWYRSSIGGELAFVDLGDDRAEQALDNKKEALNRAQSSRSIATNTNRQGDVNVT